MQPFPELVGPSSHFDVPQRLRPYTVDRDGLYEPARRVREFLGLPAGTA